MFFGVGFKNKKVKELRKNQGLTAKELAELLKVDTVEILSIDDLQLKDVREPLRTMITPVLKGTSMNKIPW